MVVDVQTSTIIIQYLPFIIDFHAIFFSVLKHAYNYTASNIIREEQKQQLIREIIEDMPATMEERDTKYYSVFHGAENKKFHETVAFKARGYEYMVEGLIQ